MTLDEFPWQRGWAEGSKDGSGQNPISVDDLESFFGQQAVPAALAVYVHELRRTEQKAARKLAETLPLDSQRLKAVAKSITSAARRLLDSGG